MKSFSYLALLIAVPIVACSTVNTRTPNTAPSGTDFSSTQKQAQFITKLFAEFQKCKINIPCTISGFQLEKLDPNSGAANGLIHQEKHFFNSIIKKNDKFSSPKDFDNSDSGFPAWAFYNKEFYLFFGMVENGDKFELVNIFKIKSGKSHTITSKDKFMSERFSNDLLILNLFLTSEKQKELSNYVGSSFLMNVDMQEGGSTYYKLTDRKYLCGISEDSEATILSQCDDKQLKAYLKSL
ncbi:MAG: hypothetical protein IT287_08445 [Bdellovibrionaceae bacterium]|nr:hypothetical protein [Pseudobdellovibrionaceae bacterium]